MVRALLLSIIAMVMTMLGGASAVAAESSDEAAVAQAVEAFRKATLNADKSQFQALTAETLSYGHSTGQIQTRAQFIDAAGGVKWKSITLTLQATQIVGDTAIVRHTFTGEFERNGTTAPTRLGVLMVWHKQDGRWKLLARQAVKLNPE